MQFKSNSKLLDFSSCLRSSPPSLPQSIPPYYRNTVFFYSFICYVQICSLSHTSVFVCTNIAKGCIPNCQHQLSKLVRYAINQILYNIYVLLYKERNIKYCLVLKKKKNSKCKHCHLHCQAEKRNKVKWFIWEYSNVLSKSEYQPRF